MSTGKTGGSGKDSVLSDKETFKGPSDQKVSHMGESSGQSSGRGESKGGKSGPGAGHGTGQATKK